MPEQDFVKSCKAESEERKNIWIFTELN